MQPTTLIRNGSQFIAEQCGSTLIIRLKLQTLHARLSERDRYQVSELLARYSQVIVDFADVATSNSTGLDMIADWVKFVRSSGNALVLAQCSKPILSLLGILQISRVVPVIANLRDALDYFEIGSPVMDQHAG